jgi:predicted dehydrogenase
MALVRTAASAVSVGTERTLLEFAGKSLLGKARQRPDLLRQTLDKARREGLLSTLDAVLNRLDQTLTLGYSSSGTVLEVGEGVRSVRVGDRVACGGGGYAVHAEYAVVPERLMALMPAGVSMESGAFVTLAAIVLHGLRLGGAQLGDRVAVIGLGLLGQLGAGLARAAGCEVLGVDLDPARVALAQQLGVNAVTREEAPEAALAATGGRGHDLVLICADTDSSDPVELAGDIARDRAHVVAVGAVGLEIPRRLYYEKELRFVVSRSYGPGRYDPDYEEKGRDYPIGYVRWTEGRNMAAVVEMLEQGRLEVGSLITHRFPIERGQEAYALIRERGREPFLGVLITYPQAEEAAPPARGKVPLARREVRAEKEIRLGVLGAGQFATGVLLPALSGLRDVELLGIASASGRSAASAGKRFGFQYAASGPEEILGDQRVNTIAVLTRHHLHASLTERALEAGKHVFCEKPLALDRQQLERVVEAWRGSPGLLMVGFNRRFAPLALQMKAFLAPVAGPLAMHYRVNAGPLPGDHWLHDPEVGGGRMIGEGCHFIDFLTYLAGAEPTRVHAVGLPDDGRYQEDNLLVTLEFADGSIGSLHYLANGDRAFPKERVEVFGGGRVAMLEDFRRLEMVAEGRRQVERSRLRQDKGHRGECQALVEALQSGGEPPIPMGQLAAVTMATFAVIESLRASEPVEVDLPRLR